MASNDYTELRAWLERKGAKRLGALTDGFTTLLLGHDLELWSYHGLDFIVGRERKRVVTTGGVLVFVPAGADGLDALPKLFREEDVRQARHKHHAGPGSCALPEGEHLCNRPGAHEGDHHCACGETWTQVEGDNALLTHPADTKKKPERVRGFQI